MSAHILKRNGQVIIRSTYRHLTEAEMNSEVAKEERITFNKGISEVLGPGVKPSDFSDEEIDTPEFEAYGDDVSPDEPKMPEADDYAEAVFDKYILWCVLRCGCRYALGLLEVLLLAFASLQVVPLHMGQLRMGICKSRIGSVVLPLFPCTVLDLDKVGRSWGASFLTD